MYKGIQSGFLYNNLELEITQMSINRKKDQFTAIFSISSHSKKLGLSGEMAHSRTGERNIKDDPGTSCYDKT